MQWFGFWALNGGDILVLRTSEAMVIRIIYLANKKCYLVETIVLNNSSAADESYIHTKFWMRRLHGLQVEINGIILIILEALNSIH